MLLTYVGYRIWTPRDTPPELMDWRVCARTAGRLRLECNIATIVRGGTYVYENGRFRMIIESA